MGDAADPDSGAPWLGYIRMLMYPIIFQPDPLASVDRVIELVVDRAHSRAVFADAIRIALAGDWPLATAIPQDHSEEVVRRFLAEVARRIELTHRDP